MSKKRIAVFVSGGGTNLQALIDACRSGVIDNGEIVCVLSSRDDAYALKRAEKAGIPTVTVARKSYETSKLYDGAVLEAVGRYDVDLIVLAGFMSILGSEVIRRYENRIINVHPSLIPSFCGKGFYGLRVHEAALNYGVKVSGATVHFVNEVTDGGAIIMQKAVNVLNGDTPETLQRRIMEEAEWQILPEAVSLFCDGKIRVENGKTIIE